MSLRGPRCGKHPSHLLVGVCALCLRERLAGLADVERASDGANAHHSRKKKQLPAVLGAHKQSAERRAADGPFSNASVEAVASRGEQDDSARRSSAMHLRGVASNGTDKSLAPETMSAARKQPNRLSTIGTSPKISAAKGQDPTSAELPKPGVLNSITSTAAIAMACDTSSGSEMPPGRCSYSSVKRPSFAHSDCDTKSPRVENVENIGTDSSSKMHSQKSITAACMSPLTGIFEHPKLTSSASQGHRVTSSDSKQRMFNSLHSVRKLPFTELGTEFGKDEKIALSDASLHLKLKKKTLSSLFTLDDTDFPSSKVSKNSANAKADAPAPPKHLSHAKSMQRRCKHGSFSDRVEPTTYLFPVPEAINNKSASWFSSLFQRRKKKSHSKVGETLASFTECNIGWEDARQSWDAPRPSAWEQFRLSSFEGPSSSWERVRPSWEGVMRTSDAESGFSGFDFPVAEGVVDVKEDVQACTQQNKQEFTAVDRRSLDIKRFGLNSKALTPNMPCSDKKARPHSFLPAKATLIQRDVSTQTTPPRSSDATEISFQQRPHQNHLLYQQHQVKPPHAIWSKVWTKAFLNSKWAFKQKHQRERQPKEMGDALVSVDEAQEQGRMALGRSSFHDGTRTASTHHPKLTCFDNIEEHEAWDTFYSPLQQGKQAMSRPVLKGDIGSLKDEQSDKARGSTGVVENGLLKFYLTPVRGQTKQGM